MEMKKLLFVAPIIVASTFAQAGVAWDESLNGDLSSVLGVPTTINVSAGDNVVMGSIGPESSDWQDVFNFNIVDGSKLSKVIIQNYTQSDADYTTFLLSPITETCNCGGYTVYSNISSSSIGTDLGPMFTAAYNNDASQYFSLWEINPATYQINFVFEPSAVPEPSTWLLFGFGSLSVAGLTRKTRRGQ